MADKQTCHKHNGFKSHRTRGHIVCKGRSPLCPPLPGKALKLFISIDTSPNTLSPRFDLALVQRGRACGISTIGEIFKRDFLGKVYISMDFHILNTIV